MARRRAGALLFWGVVALYLFRKLGQRWGATVSEARGALPGDEIVPHPMMQTTHAITIWAAPEQVWPWILQMGYYRGGWYTDTNWWDYLADRYLRALVRKETEASGYAHRDAPSADRILPEFQHLEVGEVILDGPPGTAFFTVAALEPNRLLALRSTTHLRYALPRAIRENPRFGVGGEFTWAFILNETTDGDTRLLLRTRANVEPWPYRRVMDAFLPMVDWALARKLLQGVKARAERAAA